MRYAGQCVPTKRIVFESLLHWLSNWRLPKNTKSDPQALLFPNVLRGTCWGVVLSYQNLDQLPGLLRLYADYIEAAHKLTASLAPKAAIRYKAGATYALIDCVRRLC